MYADGHTVLYLCNYWNAIVWKLDNGPEHCNRKHTVLSLKSRFFKSQPDRNDVVITFRVPRNLRCVNGDYLMRI